jgi:hypothetical protein
VNTANPEENAPGAGSKSKIRKGSRQLIRLDDLIPEKDVKGGSQILFGVTDTTQPKNNTKQDSL